MTDGPRRTRPRDPSPVDAGDLPIDDVMDVQGDAPPIDQDAVIGIDEIEHERTPTRTELDAGYSIPDLTLAGGEAAVLDGLDVDELREGETDDPGVAAQEGLTYVPPIDPPVVPDPEAGDGIPVAAGMAVSADPIPTTTTTGEPISTRVP